MVSARTASIVIIICIPISYSLWFVLSERLKPFAVSSKSCGYISSAMLGRLGSQMFMYATAFGLNHNNSKSLLLPKQGSQQLRETFSNMSVTFYDAKELNLIKWVHINPTGRRMFVPEYMNLSCGENVNIDKELISWLYFAGLESKLRKEFIFERSILDKCLQVVNNIKQNSSCLLIGAHLRRGDFTNEAKRLYGHVAAREDLLSTAVQYYTKRFPKTCLKFVVLGNDYNFNLNVSQSIRHHAMEVLRPSTAAQDLCILSKCDHSIVSGGTFGWMAAFLSNGITLYQKEQSVKGSHVEKNTKIQDYIPRDWIAI